MKKTLAIILLLFYTTIGVSAIIDMPSMNGGELSPITGGRFDLKKYYSGSQKIENMVVQQYGGVEKRPGTYEIAEANSVSRLIPFEYSTTQSYVIEAGDGYFRFYKED